MNIAIENNMTIESLSRPVPPPLVRIVSAEIPWDEWPYNLSFPPSEDQAEEMVFSAPALETQVSSEIPWAEWPYFMAFTPSGISKL